MMKLSFQTVCWSQIFIISYFFNQNEEHIIDTLKSINYSFTHQNFDRPILTFCLILAKKKNNTARLGFELSVDQNSIVLTITPMVPC